MTITKNDIPINQITSSMSKLFRTVKLDSSANMRMLSQGLAMKNQSDNIRERIESRKMRIDTLYPEITEQVKTTDRYREGYIKGITKGISIVKQKSNDVGEKGILGKIADFFTGGNKGVKPKALGGPVDSGSPYLVGEDGPEMIVPSSDGQVITNTNIKSIMKERNIDQLNSSVGEKIVILPVIRNNQHTTIVK